MARESFEIRSKLTKYDDSLGLVFGWAIVCTEDGKEYFDLDGDCVTESDMLAKSVDFMENARTYKEMHDGESRGSVVFAFPMTEEVAKAFDMETNRTGLMIAVKPDEDSLEKWRSGEFTGFSIGGTRDRSTDEEV